MKRDRFNQENDAEHTRNPLTAGAVLLGIYVAMYLAVAAVLHGLAPSDASAASNATQQQERTHDYGD